MKEKISIREIARALDTSIATVSRALNNKPGVSDALRKKVLDMAEEYGYTPNILASGMRTQMLNVLAIFPYKDSGSNLYTDHIWEGYINGKSYFTDHKVYFYECYIEGLQKENDQKILQTIAVLKEEKIKIDAALVYYVGNNTEIIQFINELVLAEVPVVALHKKNADMLYTSFVTDQAKQIGALAAELLYKFYPKHEEVLLIENTYEDLGQDDVARSFKEKITSYFPNVSLHLIDVFDPQAEQKVLDILQNSNTSACFGSTARASVMLSKTLMKNKFESVLFVGASKNKVSEDALAAGVSECIIDTNAFEEGHQAMLELYHVLIAKNKPEQLIEIPLRVFFEANLP